MTNVFLLLEKAPFGDHDTHQLKKCDLTLVQLASASVVSRSILSQIEHGRASPTLAVTLHIAKAFRLSIGDLVDQP
ncbi:MULTISPECIES: helix-turn-helix domain-containing protein [unclassified Cobetia]|uniref:helix-turn-helix domain-containing protein n=1 Tax=unclassified Cobetia TaxID=2609414 RepID=UPI00178C9367|nr:MULTISPECIES: helix-turn-helix transcriptional regulator [unclassified Cobetia]MBE2170254.1 helix-turn-helix transcriptional regulator [Cobetia sp. 2AS1]MDH2446968.1 helix-turn-helix transcriptional regulator [Cobetia sp. 2AS]